MAGITQKIPTRHKNYSMFVIEPLHIDTGPIQLPAENLQIDQTFDPNYSSEEVYGRMDPIVTYKNTKRSISINFSCQAHHFFDGAAGVKNNVESVNLITQMLYPSYHDINNNLGILKAPPFFRITYGSYVGSYSNIGLTSGLENGLTGYISNFRHGLGKIARNMAYAATEDGGYHALPREIKISFTFNVVHDKEVGWRKRGNNYVFSDNGYGMNFPYNVGEEMADWGPDELWTEGTKIVDDDSTVAAAASPGGESSVKAEAGDTDKPPKNSKTGADAKVKDCKEKWVLEPWGGKTLSVEGYKAKAKAMGPEYSYSYKHDSIVKKTCK